MTSPVDVPHGEGGEDLVPPIAVPVTATSRTRRLLVNSASAVGTRLIASVSGVLVVGTSLRYLGAENYGMWQTIVSSLMLLGTTDLGMGSALLTRLAQLEGVDDRSEQRRELSTALVLFLGVALGGIVLMVLLVGLLDWASILNTKGTEAARWSDRTVLVAGVLTAAAIPLGLIDRVQNSIQRGWRVQVAQSLGYIAVPITLVLAVRAEVSPPTIAATVLLTAMVFQAVNAGLFFTTNPELRPMWGGFDRGRARRLLRQGFLFFIITITGLLAFASDNLVVARILGPAAAAEYSVAYKLFSVLAVFVVLPLAALWPAYAEALERRDAGWVRQTYRRSILIAGGLGTLGGIAVMVGGRIAIDLWVGGEVEPSTSVLIAFGLWLPIYCIGNSMSVLLNAAALLRFQIYTAMVMLPTNLVLSVLFTRWWGVGGAVFGSILAFCACTGAPSLVYLHRFLAGLDDAGGTVPAEAAP